VGARQDRRRVAPSRTDRRGSHLTASVHVWYVNRKFLPKELQPPVWRQVMLFVMCGFFGFFTLATILSRVFGINL
jgi:hypothetical protein